MKRSQTDEIYSLKDLCRDAQVTERTVRYYIQEGLLPPPEGAGPFARYNRQHLLRLRLIRRLKDEYLPLAEIRRRLADLNPTELETLNQQTLPAGEYDEEEADAKNYLDRLLGKSEQANALVNGSVTGLPLRSAWPPPPAPLPSKKSEQALSTKDGSADSVSLAEATSETWQRLTLAPGVELHYQPGDSEQRRQIDRLLEEARQIFKR
ncbi:MAG: MerR family transcriptional regulator [Chloroflexi bacterium]|nr:MerR family transcriptional regulator [Chloroflexota bacterium]